MEERKLETLPTAGAWVWALRLLAVLGLLLPVLEWALPPLWMALIVPALLGGYFFVICWYLPARYRSLAFGLCQRQLVLQGGVFYQSRRCLPLQGLNGSASFQSPLQRLFGAQTLCFLFPGRMVVLDGVPVERADRLLADITALQRELAP